MTTSPRHPLYFFFFTYFHTEGYCRVFSLISNLTRILQNYTNTSYKLFFISFSIVCLYRTRYCVRIVFCTVLLYSTLHRSQHYIHAQIPYFNRTITPIKNHKVALDLIVTCTPRNINDWSASFEQPTQIIRLPLRPSFFNMIFFNSFTTSRSPYLLWVCC